MCRLGLSFFTLLSHPLSLLPIPLIPSTTPALPLTPPTLQYCILLSVVVLIEVAIVILVFVQGQQVRTYVSM